MDRCTRLLFRRSLTGSQIGEAILPQTKKFALSVSCLRKGLATGIVIGGFGSGALFFAPSMNYLMSKFSVAPAFLGSSGVDLVTEGGRQFALVGGNLQEVVYASASELARLPFSGLAEGFYLVGSGSTGVALAYSTMGLAYTAIILASSLALKRAPPGFEPQVLLHPRIWVISLLAGSFQLPRVILYTSSACNGQGWRPAEGTAAPMARSVHVDVVPSTPQVSKVSNWKRCRREESSKTKILTFLVQFWLLFSTSALLCTGGMGLMAVAKPMITEVF